MKKLLYALIILAILIRIPLLFINPISMFSDAVFRFIPSTYDVISGSLAFYTPPVLIILNAIPTLFLKGILLEVSWKIFPFLFFILSCIIFIKILRNIELKSIEKILLLCLFLFSVYSILLSTTIMLEMPVLFFALCLFYILEKNGKIDMKIFWIIVLLSALMLYSKETGYFIWAGFVLYCIFAKMDNRNKKIVIFALILGLLLNVPWMIKNEIYHGSIIGANSAGYEIIVNNSFLDFSKNPMSLISDSFHYFYRMPSLSQLNFGGILYLPSRIYYFVFLIINILLSIAMLFGIFKYGRKYLRYIMLILPIFLFSFWWAFLSPAHSTNDFGRYMFSFYFLFFFFELKFVENIKWHRIRQGFYLVVILFCIFSIITSYAISQDIYKRDKAVREVSEAIKNINGRFVCNDMFTSTTLSYYSGKKIDFLLNENRIDESIRCDGEIIFSSQNYLVSFKGSQYNICKI